MDSKDTRSLYDEILRLSAAIAERQQDASIMFVDLAGSTEFKTVNGPILGLEKTFIHNSLVTKTVANNGEVVKYIGDEVMVVTRDANHARTACHIAIQIQRDLAALNQRHAGDPRFPIESKIGIHSGPVQYWKYSDHDPLDPQGTTVDVAARIVSLAKPQQILYCQECSERSAPLGTELGPAVQRNVKGIRGPIKLVEILWDGTTRSIAQNPTPVTNDPLVRSLVREAREHVRAGNIEAARQAFQAALQKAPADFNANLGLGELLLRKLGNVTEGETFLDTARQINPSSPSLLLIDGFLEWQRYKETEDGTCLDRAITLTEECLKLAEVNIDYHTDRLGQGNLAYYLTERAHNDDLDRALRLCENTSQRYDRIQTRGRSEFMDTYAFTLLKRGTKDDVIKARKLLEESIKCDPQNPYPHEHMAELIRKEHALNIIPVRGWDY